MLPIEHIKEIKFLGIILNEYLDWKPHIDMIKNKISKNIGVIFRTKTCFTKGHLLTLYNSLILPYLTYGCLLWGHTYSTNVNKLRVIQRKFLKNINNLNKREHLNLTCFKANKILVIDDVIKLNTAVYMFKTKQKLFPPFFNNPVQLNIRHHNTRGNEFVINFCRTDVARQFIANVGPRLWNQLDNELKIISSIWKFKNRFKANIFNNYIL